MKKVVVNIHEIVADIKAKISDRELMAKYALSFNSVRKVKDQLLGRGLVTIHDLRAKSNDGHTSDHEKLDGDEFLKDFREHPDDYYLMEKYRLSGKELGHVYSYLMSNRMLTEFEFFARERKTPELEDSATLSTCVTTNTTGSEGRVDPWAAERYRDNDASDNRYTHDFSGIGKGSRKGSTDRALGRDDDFQEEHQGVSTGTSTIVEFTAEEICPQCGRSKSSAGARACWVCGYVFPKSGSGARRISLWDTDVTDE